MAHIQKLEEIFKEVNNDRLLISKNYLHTLLNKAAAITCAEKVKKLFFRARMYFRMKGFNEEIRKQIHTRKRKLTKTIT